MTIKAALLDERGIFLRIEEVDAPTDRHLAQITECDLPPGEYVWVADEANQYGGAFWSVAWLQSLEADRVKVQESGRLKAMDKETLRQERAAKRNDRRR